MSSVPSEVSSPEGLALLSRIANAVERLTARGLATRQKTILSQREAARRLGLRNTTVADLIFDGKLKAVRVNGRWKVPAAEVERLAADGFDTRQP